MFNNFLTAGYVLFFSCIVSLVTVYTSIHFARLFNVLDYPRGGRTHEKPMPLLGGVGIFVAILIVIGIHILVLTYGQTLIPSALLKYLPSPNAQAWHKLAIILGGGALITILGIMDDIKQTRVEFRFAAQSIIAFGVVALGIRPSLSGLPEALVFILTILWIVGITNSFNLVDGIDGLAGSLCMVAGMVFMLFMLLTGQVIVAILLATLIGSVAGFLGHNWHPAKTYMGSGGSLMLGYMLATIPLVSDFMQYNENSLAPILLPVLALSVPLYDTASVIFLRLGHNRSPFKSDHNHLAHRLLRIGLSIPQTVAAMSLLGFATGMMSMLLRNATTVQALLVLLSVGAMFAVFIILERVHLSHHDSKRLVSIPAFCVINSNADKQPIPSTAKVISIEDIQLSVDQSHISDFAEAMCKKRTVSIEFTSNDIKLPLPMLCNITTIWRADNDKAFIGLSPVYPDEYTKKNANRWIAKATYPSRKQETPLT